jgi:hypothetical protein
MRAIAVTSDKRLPGVDVPTLKEQGIDVVIGNWRGVFGAPGITAEQRKALTDMILKATKSKAWAEAMEKNAVDAGAADRPRVRQVRRRRVRQPAGGDGQERDDLMASAVVRQGAVAGGVLALGVLLASGALTIPAAAGYAGVGPNFLPWVVATGLLLCGALPGLGGVQRRLPPDGRPGRRRARPLAGFRLGECRHPGQRRVDHHHRLHPQLRAVLHAGGAWLQVGRRPARPVGAGLGHRCADRHGHRRAGVLDVHPGLLAISLPGLTNTGWL